MAQGPVFLERRSYRIRRMIDVIRILPIIGLVLWMVPLLWPVAEVEGVEATARMPTSVALQYLFGIWLVLVVLGWVLWRWTSRTVGKLDVMLRDQAD